ncbi:MAG TPA: hypothetical protein VFY73_02000 [Ideonella sp.]|uniref:hypothetical protein n=1 Tax=Ideonella sp. TaxID=1929293 RepID=UPI002E37730B|nr:hypothetical protein [Ideonella sp.]HEX5682781.1 hypothetical protein [Ideonella sp.]
MLGALLGSAGSFAQAAPATQAQIQLQETAASTAAAQDLARFAQHHQKVHADALPKGFPLAVDSVADLARLRLGRGFAVYTVEPADIASGSDLSSAAKPTGQWRFVVRLGSRPVGLVTLDQANGQWQAVSYGGAALAGDVDAKMRQHGTPDRANLRFVRIFQAHSDFLEVVSPADGRVRLAPLLSARASLRMPVEELLEQGDVLPSLRAAVAANLAEFQP